jgi:hypothetical protein
MPVPQSTHRRSDSASIIIGGKSGKSESFRDEVNSDNFTRSSMIIDLLPPSFDTNKVRIATVPFSDLNSN